MSKITGEEPINSFIEPNETCGVSLGMPIRLHIAAMLYSNNSIGAEEAISQADELIRVFNEIHNPNAQ